MAEQDIPIHELVAKIKRGDIKLPEMQRQYVWQKTRVRDLLDSLYRKYPSGTILTWETDGEVATRKFDINQDLSQQKQRGHQLLLDGQQRLTSLSAILLGEPVYVKGLKRPIDILFNLEHPEEVGLVTEVIEDEEAEDNTDIDLNENTIDASEDELMKRFESMTFVVHSKKLAQLPHWVPVTEVFTESSDKPFLKKAGVTEMEDPRYDKYTTRLTRLRDIKNYSYRVHILDRDKTYEEVTEIFVRVNSLGAKLRGSDLALAQITAKWRNSLQLFQNFKEECATKHGFDIDLSIHIKNLVAFVTNQSRFKILGRLSKEDLEKGWENAKKGMEYALNFLSSNVNVENQSLLSSPYILITLAKYADSKGYELSDNEEKQLRYWILVANAKARYSKGSSESLLDQDLTTIHRNKNIGKLLQSLETQVGRLDILPEDLENRSTRSAYFKTMFLAFQADNARDWEDQLSISLKHSGTTHKLQFHHIFPKALLEKVGMPPQRINDICNMAFIGERTNKRISDKEPAIYLPDVIKKGGANKLDKQCIPNDKSLWEMDAYEDFLKVRRKLVAERLNRFLGHNQWESST